MSALAYYYSTHLRTLLISKYNYKNSGEVARLGTVRFQMSVPTSSNVFINMWLFLLVSGSWPSQRRLTWQIKGRRERVALLLMWRTLRSQPLLRFFLKCRMLYFPLLDADDRHAETMFQASQLWRNAVSCTSTFLVTSFIELDYLTNFKINVAKACIKQTQIQFFFTSSSSSWEMESVVRGLQFPLELNRG